MKEDEHLNKFMASSDRNLLNFLSPEEQNESPSFAKDKEKDSKSNTG